MKVRLLLFSLWFPVVSATQHCNTYSGSQHLSQAHPERERKSESREGHEGGGGGGGGGGEGKRCEARGGKEAMNVPSNVDIDASIFPGGDT